MVAICRLCASLKKSETMTFIRAESHVFCDKLLKCCQLAIDLNNVLPRGVCPECVRNLNASFEFYERVHESQQSLEKLFLNVQPKSKIVTENVSFSVEEEKVAEEQKSFALVTAANRADIDNPQPSEVEATAAVTKAADTSDPLTILEEGSNDIDDDDVNQEVSQEANKEVNQKEHDQEVKEETTSKEFTFSVKEAGTSKNNTRKSNKETYEVRLVSGEEILTDVKTGELITSNDKDDLTSIEYVDEDVEEDFDFDNGHYEVIEVDSSMRMREEQEDNDRDVDLPMRSSPDGLESQDLNYIEEEDANSLDIAPLAGDAMNSSTWFDYPWKCVTCSETFYTAQELVDHNAEVEQLDTVWFCADCLKVFPRYYALINHIRQRHRPHLALLCDICNTSCESFKELVTHRQSMHDSEILKMLLCPTCGKGFNTSNSLQIHSKCHLPDDLRLRFSCSLCDKKFRSASNMKFHKKMHAGLKDYVCDQCGKKFIQKANLEEHLLTHIDFTPYECDLCKKLFKTSERLTKHKKCHTDDKPFNCTWDICDRTFRSKDAMLTHVRIHTGEMPFQCEFCDKRFRFRSVLMTHHNVHTGVRPYSCLDCDHHFTNWPNYNKHMKRRHGIDVSSNNPRGKKPSKPKAKDSAKKSHSVYEVNLLENPEACDVNYVEEEEFKEADLEDFDDDAEYKPDEDIN